MDIGNQTKNVIALFLCWPLTRNTVENIHSSNQQLVKQQRLWFSFLSKSFSSQIGVNLTITTPLGFTFTVKESLCIPNGWRANKSRTHARFVKIPTCHQEITEKKLVSHKNESSQEPIPIDHRKRTTAPHYCHSVFTNWSIIANSDSFENLTDQSQTRA